MISEEDAENDYDTEGNRISGLNIEEEEELKASESPHVSGGGSPLVDFCDPEADEVASINDELESLSI